MMRDSISIAMATYNGEKYIENQLKSILSQLKNYDEVIISDDGSTDNTIHIIEELNDQRIKIIDGPKKGIIKNFENAIVNCKNDYIFLSDQDDYWMPNKVERVLKEFKEKKALLVMHDCVIKNVDTGKIISDSFFKLRNCKTGIARNVIKDSYIGCCMAFSKKLIPSIVPIPTNIAMHDQWIGLIGDFYKKNYFIDDKLIEYRRHEGNASDCFHHSQIGKMIKNRFCLIIELIKRRVKCIGY